MKILLTKRIFRFRLAFANLQVNFASKTVKIWSWFKTNWTWL